jgi:Skp family chaperone for outer membrane proteins
VLAAVLAFGVPAATAFGQAPAPAPGATETQTPAAAPQPERPPFQDGFKYAYVDIQQIAATSKEGAEAAKSIKSLQDRLERDIVEKQKILQSTQEKLTSQSSVLADTARIQLQADVERLQRDIQRMVEDAERDIGRLTDSLQNEFMRKLNPVIDRIAREKQIHMIFNAADSGLVWAAPGMDLTGEIIRAFDGGAGAPAAPAAPPAAPAAER